MLTDKQRALFDALASCSELIFAIGSRGISANIVGEFVVRPRGDEFRLEVGDGTQHVHVDWSRVKRVEIADRDGEGMLTFFDGDERLFRLYRPAGPLSAGRGQTCWGPRLITVVAGMGGSPIGALLLGTGDRRSLVPDAHPLGDR